MCTREPTLCPLHVTLHAEDTGQGKQAAAQAAAMQATLGIGGRAGAARLGANAGASTSLLNSLAPGRGAAPGGTGAAGPELTMAVQIQLAVEYETLDGRRFFATPQQLGIREGSVGDAHPGTTASTARPGQVRRETERKMRKGCALRRGFGSREEARLPGKERCEKGSPTPWHGRECGLA